MLRNDVLVLCIPEAIVLGAPGTHSCEVLVGEGAAINGVDDLGDLAMAGFDIDGNLLVVAINRGDHISRLIKIDEQGGSQFHPEHLARPLDFCFAGDGAMYVLDTGGTRIQRIKDGNVVVVASSHGSEGDLTKLRAVSICALGDEAVCIADAWNHRVLKFGLGVENAEVIAGGIGKGGGIHQLRFPWSLAPGTDGSIFVADARNHRVMQWRPSAQSGTVVAGGNGRGTSSHQLDHPMHIAIDSIGSIYVLDCPDWVDGVGWTWDHCARITRWGPPPKLELDRMDGNMCKKTKRSKPS